jgi:hypothetical protein
MIHKYIFSFASLYSSIASYVIIKKHFNQLKYLEYKKNIKNI